MVCPADVRAVSHRLAIGVRVVTADIVLTSLLS